MIRTHTRHSLMVSIVLPEHIVTSSTSARDIVTKVGSLPLLAASNTSEKINCMSDSPRALLLYAVWCAFASLPIITWRPLFPQYGNHGQQWGVDNPFGPFLRLPPSRVQVNLELCTTMNQRLRTPGRFSENFRKLPEEYFWYCQKYIASGSSYFED